jgi:uncharacterized protein YgiM (DUF1202 family)
MTSLIKNALLACALLCSTAPASWAQVQKQVKPIANGGWLNVRTGPGATYTDIGDIPQGTVITVIGYDATQKWAIINWNGQAAYVSARFLTAPGTAPAPANTPPVINDGLGDFRVTGIRANDPDGGLVVRAGPGKSYSRLMVLPQGTGVRIIEVSPNRKWSRARFSDGGSGWMRNRYLAARNPAPQSPPPPSTGAANGWSLPGVFTVTGVSANDVLRVRAAPDASANRLADLQPGGIVAVLAPAGGNWVRVSLSDGSNGYVNARYLTPGGGTTTGTGMQTGLRCAGTEPFWQFNIARDGRTRFEDAGNAAPPVFSRLAGVSGFGFMASYPFDFQTANVVGKLDTRLCSDGMSDIDYPFSLQLDAPLGGAMRSVTGCCLLQ